MRAVVFDQHGPPEALRVADLPVPEPGPGQIRFRVRATGVQPFDTVLRQGGSGFPVTASPEPRCSSRSCSPWPPTRSVPITGRRRRARCGR